MNQVAFAKWTNGEQAWQRKLKFLIVGNVVSTKLNDENNFYNDVNLLEVNDQSTVLSPHLDAYFEFSQKLLISLETTLQIHKKGQEDMVLVNVKKSSQMEDRRKQLVMGQGKLDELVEKLKQSNNLLLASTILGL